VSIYLLCGLVRMESGSSDNPHCKAGEKDVLFFLFSRRQSFELFFLTVTLELAQVNRTFKNVILEVI